MHIIPGRLADPDPFQLEYFHFRINIKAVGQFNPVRVRFFFLNTKTYLECPSYRKIFLLVHKYTRLKFEREIFLLLVYYDT